MKLYNSNFAPSPRRVRIFLAEKGVFIPRIEVDLGKLEHKRPQFSARNPFETIPALELDDGTMIDELIAICRYIEELHPEPNLFGATALERALVEMWQRRLEWRLLLPIAQAFRHSHPRMAEMENPQVPAFGAASRPKALGRWRLSTRPSATGDSSPATASPSPTSRGSSRSTSPNRRESRSRPSLRILTAGVRRSPLARARRHEAPALRSPTPRPFQAQTLTPGARHQQRRPPQ